MLAQRSMWIVAWPRPLVGLGLGSLVGWYGAWHFVLQQRRRTRARVRVVIDQAIQPRTHRSACRRRGGRPRYPPLPNTLPRPAHISTLLVDPPLSHPLLRGHWMDSP